MGWILYIVTALIVVRRAERTVTLAMGALAGLLIAASMAPLAASTDTAAQGAGLLARSVGLAVVFTVAFPLGAVGAVAAGVGIGAASGLLMLAVGLTASVAPVGSAALASAVSDRYVYILMGVVALLTSALMLAVRTRVSGETPAVPPEP